MSRISQPVGQVRLTNVAVVRMKRGGKRFEVAAYKNKVVNWRNRVETDLDEVLQTTTVFSNVSKGIAANKKDLVEQFGTADETKVAMTILDKGELEISDKERAAAFESTFHDVATIIAQKCVNPDTNKPYTVSMIERALHDVHFTVNPAKPAKQQALKAISTLRKHYAIERARMRVRITVPVSGEPALRSRLASLHVAIDGEGMRGTGDTAMVTMDAVIDPGVYRTLEDVVADMNERRTGGGAGAGIATPGSTEAEGGISTPTATAVVSGMSGAKAMAMIDVLSLSVTADGEGMDTLPVPTEPVGGSGRSGVGHKARAGAGSEGDASDDSGSSDGRGPSTTAPAPPRRRLGGDDGSMEAGEGDLTSAAAKGTGMVVRRVAQPGRRLHCSTCGVGFDDASAHRDHARSDLHRFNLKRKLKGMEAVSAEAYDALPIKERTAFLESYD